MPIISVRSKGDFSKAKNVFEKWKRLQFEYILKKYATQGLSNLAANTPVDTGKTASSWEANIVETEEGYNIEFNNTNINKGVNIAIILQYGHGTRNGGYVRGRDYINPALQPIFEKMADDCWKEVTMIR